MNSDYHDKIMEVSRSFRKTLIISQSISGIIIVGLIVLVAYLSIYKTYVELVPPTIQKKMTLGRGYVDDEYLAEEAEYILWLRNNVTPDTVKRNYGQLLRMVTPENWGAMRGVLAREARIIMKDKISATLYIKKVRVSEKALAVKVNAIQEKWVGERKLPDQKMDYYVQFRMDHGAISLNSITELPEAKSDV